MQPSELPVVEVPTGSAPYGARQRSASILTISTVCGYSSWSIMFLSKVAA
jgi:hypothetical protein